MVLKAVGDCVVRRSGPCKLPSGSWTKPRNESTFLRTFEPQNASGGKKFSEQIAVSRRLGRGSDPGLPEPRHEVAASLRPGGLNLNSAENSIQ